MASGTAIVATLRRGGSGSAGVTGGSIGSADGAAISRGGRWWAAVRRDRRGAGAGDDSSRNTEVPIRTSSPQRAVPFVEPRSSTCVAPHGSTWTRAWRVDTAGSASRTSPSARPITNSPAGSGTRCPASGPRWTVSTHRIGGPPVAGAPSRTSLPAATPVSSSAVAAGHQRPSTAAPSPVAPSAIEQVADGRARPRPDGPVGAAPLVGHPYLHPSPSCHRRNRSNLVDYENT